MIARPTPSDGTVRIAKVVALALFFAFAPFAWLPEVHDSVQVLRRLPFHFAGEVVYLSVVLLAFAGLVVAPFLRNTPLRTLFVGLFVTIFAVDHVVLASSGSHLDAAMVQILWQGRALTGVVARDFWPIIASHLIATAALATVLAWPLAGGLRGQWALVPMAAVVVVPLHYGSWGEMLAGYPSPFLIPARLAWVVTAPPTHSQLPLKPVTLPRSSEAARPFDKIVFVMDESVRGDYLSINNRGMRTTPFLEEYADRIVNFGIGTSGSNCSYQSRWMFRRGVRPWQLPDRPSLINDGADGIETGPRTTLWQFAKAAGYKTVYIDPWSGTFGDVHSGLTHDELRFIDERIVLNGPSYDRDIEAARILRSMLQRNERLFVHVDKFGTHFPYDASSPPEFNRFARADGARYEYYRKTLDDLTGSYKNAIAWSVDGFFRELLPGMDLSGMLLVYTSDHGQNLWDDGATFWRHCDTNPPASELWVPLFAIAGEGEFRRTLAASAARSSNEATHFEIFPTLLLAMGFDARATEAAYGSSLMNVPRGQPRRFIVGDVDGRAYRVWVDVRETGIRLRDRIASGCLSCLWR